MPIKKQMRTCTLCSQSKTINKFYHTKYRCKECMKETIKKNNENTRKWKKAEREIENMINNYSYINILYSDDDSERTNGQTDQEESEEVILPIQED